MSEEKWHRPRCCEITWVSRVLYEWHLRDDHTAAQCLTMLVEMTQQLARQRATASGLMAKVQLLGARLRDGEAEQRAMVAKFEEWQDRAGRELRLWRSGIVIPGDQLDPDS